MAAKKIGIYRELLSHPGETLKEILEFNNMTQKELAVRIGVTEKHITGIISGKNSISPDIALRLSKVFPLSVNFWNNLQANYDSEVKKLDEYESIKDEEKDIVRDADYLSLSKYGYVEATRDINDKVINMREFWGVTNLANVKTLYDPATSPLAFRKSLKCGVNPYIMASWLKVCEIETNKVTAEKYDENKLRDKLETIKSLMLKYDPNEIINDLKQIFQECGVSFAVVRNFRGAPVQGLIRRREDKIDLCVTLRGARADIFWFTLFHELGHLLTGFKNQIKIDYEDTLDGVEDKQFEEKADQYANDFLIPRSAYESFVKEANYSEQCIVRFANEHKILPCILLGRLQHEHKIPYGWHKNLLVSYKWA